MQSQFQMKPESISGDSLVKACPPGGELLYVPQWMAASTADRVFEALLQEVRWQSRTIRMFGREIAQPRRLAFQGEPGIAYRYSGGTYRAEAWHDEVAGLRDALEAETGTAFNCALLNLYRDGRDSMGWHSDDEPELGRAPVIASVSLGAGRRFVVRERNREKRQSRFELLPAHGSLIVMRGDMQHYWQHQVPRTARPVGPRINLTFRRIADRRRQPAPRRP